MNRLLGEPIETLVNGHPFPPSGKGVLRGEATKLHVGESIKAVEALRATILETLKEADSPATIMEIHEAAGASQPYTIGCTLESLKAEGKATRETTGGVMLWQV